MNQNSVSVAATSETSTAPELNDPSPMPLNIDENNVSDVVAGEFPQENEEAVNDEAVNDAAYQTVATVHGMEWVRASTNDPPLND